MTWERFTGLALFLLACAGLANSANTFSPDSPPRASLIRLSAPDASGNVTVIGAPGAVPASQVVFLVTLDTGHAAYATAGADGSFQATLFAPAGTSVIIKAVPPSLLPSGPPLNSPEPGFLLAPSGTILRVAEPAGAGPGVPFAGAGVVGGGAPNTPNPFGLPAWAIQGTMNTQSLQPGDTLSVNATLSIVSAVLKTAGSMQVLANLGIEQLSGPNGYESQAVNIFSSVFLTPTGLPIERTPIAAGLPFVGRYTSTPFAITKSDDTHAQASIQLSFQVPNNLPAGFYRPTIAWEFQNVPAENPPPVPVVLITTSDLPINARNFAIGTFLPIVRVGTPAPPRLFWTLLTDNLSNGSRGARAIEDQNRFGLSLRLLTQSETFIVPRVEAASGRVLSYRLEPFAPTVSNGDRQIPPFAPLIPFRFPSGNLTVRIQQPDGSVIVLGPAPFVQSRMKGVADAGGGPMEDGPHMANTYQLSTMDPRFEVQFPQDGRYRMRVDGSVDDIWGNTWTGGGTYEVYVARTLSLDTAVLPGTPFEVGDAFNPGLVLTPPVPANVNVRFRMAPNSDANNMIDQTVNGLANRFGYFNPPNSGIALGQPGEYRVDVTATYRDKQGNLWMGSRTWGGVVAPKNADLIAHGRRGKQQPSSAGQWFFYNDTGVPCAVDTGNGVHINLPFNSGDVEWMERACGVAPSATFQDPLGSVTSVMRTRGFAHSGPGSDRAAIGENPLFSSRPDGLDPHFDPAQVDLWGYGYVSVQRPLVRVREQIAEDGNPGYWRFRKPYMNQIGVGDNGDLQNEIKFQYAGIVVRGPAVGGAHYAVYGSEFVLLPDNDPSGGSRVFPPFQGNGGGPSGGPIMTLKGRDIDLFLHLTGVRPGTILEVGDSFALSGAVGPPLAALVSYSVTSPSGRKQNFSGRANKVGYYYRPQDDFVVSEPGMYTVDLKVTYDGQTSAGQVTQPFPTGDALGTDNGRFFFYAVSRGSAPLAVGLPADTSLTPPIQLDVAGSAPAGLNITGGHVTTMMPGFLLQTGTLTASGGRLNYHYDPQTLARDVPSLDVVGVPPFLPPQPLAADVVSISLFGSGTNADGSTGQAARVVVLHGSELFNTDQAVVVSSPAATVNAASFASGKPLSPGSIAALFGTNLATFTVGAADLPLPATLGGATVRLNGIAAPLFFVSPGQINFQVPWELAGQTQAALTVTVNGVASRPLTITLGSFSPGLFTLNSSGSGQGAILNLQGQFVNAAAPAHPGGVVVIFATGLGDVTNRPASGAPAPFQPPLAETKTQPAVTIGGVPANVLFSGLAPFFVGLYQVNVEVPANAPVGDAVPVVLGIGGSSSNTATIAVQ